METCFAKYVSRVCVCAFLGSSCLAIAQTLDTPAYPRRTTPSIGGSSIRITYGGNVIMDMGNYDVVLGGPIPMGPPMLTDPRNLLNDPRNLLNDPRNSGAPQVIFKGDTGLRWDGQRYFYHPAYPYDDIVGRYHYRNRIVGGGDERYPPLPQRGIPKQPQMAGDPILRFSPETLRQTEPRPTLPPVVPFPLPNAQERLPEICLEHPYAIQCYPAGFDSDRIRGANVPIPRAPERKIAKRKPKHSETPQIKHQTEEPRTTPRIVLLLSKDVTDSCEYELLSDRGNYARTISPGNEHTIRADRPWRIRFDTGGWGVQTYRLRSGETYRFQKNQSDVWELRWLKKDSASKVSTESTQGKAATPSGSAARQSTVLEQPGS